MPSRTSRSAFRRVIGVLVLGLVVLDELQDDRREKLAVRCDVLALACDDGLCALLELIEGYELTFVADGALVLILVALRYLVPVLATNPPHEQTEQDQKHDEWPQPRHRDPPGELLAA